MSKKHEAVDEAAVEIPPATEPATEALPASRYTDLELGLVDEKGEPLPPETAAVRYSTRLLWGEAVRLGGLCGLVDQSLYALATQFHTVYPHLWRHMLLDKLHARLDDPVASMDGEERMRRGLVHDLRPRIALAWTELSNVIGRWPEGRQLEVLEQLLRHAASIR